MKSAKFPKLLYFLAYGLPTKTLTARNIGSAENRNMPSCDFHHQNQLFTPKNELSPN